MTSYPTRKKLFTAWAKAMVEGSTVGKPDYSSTKARNRPHIAKRKRRKRKRKNAKKD